MTETSEILDAITSNLVVIEDGERRDVDPLTDDYADMHVLLPARIVDDIAEIDSDRRPVKYFIDMLREDLREDRDRLIRRLYHETDLSQRELAEVHDISQSRVNEIVNGR